MAKCLYRANPVHPASDDDDAKIIPGVQIQMLRANAIRLIVERRWHWWGITIALCVGLLAAACGGSDPPAAASEPAAAPAAQPAAGQPTPTPTPPPDPAALLVETAENLRQAQSFNFVVEHESGSIYVSTVQAKATVAKGGWNAEQGAQMTVDAYLVSGPDAPAEDGTYVELRMAVTPDSYFLTDPLSGYWTKRPFSSISIPITELNDIVAAAADSIADPVLAGEEEIDGKSAYKITGDAPATVMDWLLLFPVEGQRVDVEVWTDTEERILRQARIIGPIGEFDDADTVRKVTLSDYNATVEIEIPGPDDYLDLSNIQQ